MKYNIKLNSIVFLNSLSNFFLTLFSKKLKNYLNLRILIIFLFLIHLNNSFANREVNSPRNTLHTHLNNLKLDNYKPNISLRTLYRGKYSNKQLKTLTVKLKKVIDGKKIFVKLANVSNNENYIDSITGKNIYFLSTNESYIYLEKYGNKWLFSEETVSLIDEMYSEIYFIELTNFTEGLPSHFHKNVFGVTIWQYLGIIIFIIIAYFLSIIFKRILKFIFHKILNKLAKFDITIKYLPKISSPFSLAISLTLLDFSLNLLFLPITWTHNISFVINLLYPLLFVLLGWNISDLIGEILQSLIAKTKSKLDDQLIPFGRKLIKGLVILLGLFYFVGNLGFDYTPLLAGASIGGLALALAAQETVKNVFGSVTIFMDHPFEVGDYITFDGAEGVVEEIGLRSTRIRTMYDSVITMPNGKMADSRIDNMGLRTMRRYRTFLNLHYNTPTELIELYVSGLNELVIKHPNTNKEVYQIYLNQFSSSSVDILVNIFFFVETWDDELKARSKYITQALELAREIGISFAYPTQTLNIENFPEKVSLSPIYEINYKNESDINKGLAKENVIKKFNNYLGKQLDK